MKILVLCTGNSCRSQMAEGYLRHFAKEKAEIYSAGIEIHGVNPNAIACMQEDGIDISHHTSNHLQEYAGISFDMIITVCDHAQEHCPLLPYPAKQIHQNFSDPVKATGTPATIQHEFRKVRDQIKLFAKSFVATHLT